MCKILPASISGGSLQTNYLYQINNFINPLYDKNKIKKEKVNKIKYDKSLTNTIDLDMIKYYYKIVK